jgi:hypothetical protein
MRLIRLNRSPEGEGGGAEDTATIEKLSADVEALTTNNQKLLGEMNSVRSLNSEILGAFGVDSGGSAADKLEAVKAKIGGQKTASTSKDTELSLLQSSVKTLENSLSEITKSQREATQAKDRLGAEGEIRKQLIESKVVASAHDMILATVLNKSDKSDEGFGVTTAKGRISLADYTREVVTSIPQIVETSARPGANPSGGTAQANTGPLTYDELIAQGRFGDAMQIKNA